MTYNISDKARGTMSGSLGDGDAVKLPFSAATFWTVNGRPELSQLGGVSAFGGWASSQEELVGHMASLGLAIPAALQLSEFTGKDGNYFAYHTRVLAVAPIVYRKRNASEDPAKFRSHVQLLGYGMIHDGKTKHDLGAVILSAKGYQASNVTKAFGEWERKSAQVRRDFASGTDAKFFFLPLGTFGDKPEFVSVGKGNAQSKITPIVPQIPEPITAEHLQGRFVGAEVADKMAEMKEQAQPWLKDWAEKAATSNTPEAPDNFEGFDESQF